jgi:hypothetical protein
MQGLPLNLRPLVGGYFFLLAAFLAADFLALDFCCFDLADLLAIMLLVFSGNREIKARCAVSVSGWVRHVGIN